MGLAVKRVEFAGDSLRFRMPAVSEVEFAGVPHPARAQGFAFWSSVTTLRAFHCASGGAGRSGEMRSARKVALVDQRVAVSMRSARKVGMFDHFSRTCANSILLTSTG